MAVPANLRGKTPLDDVFSMSTSIITGGTAQPILPQQPRRLWLAISNASAADTIWLGVGPARAAPTMAGGTVASIAVIFGSIGYSVAPQVRIKGGIFNGDYETAPGSTGPQPGQTYPGRPAQATAAISGGVITGITVTDPGAGYLVAPMVYLENPWPQLGGGSTVPAANNGLPITAGQTYTFTGSLFVPGSAMAAVGATTGSTINILVGGLV